MPHNPHEQFDHSILDLIEHSPIGAVPPHSHPSEMPSSGFMPPTRSMRAPIGRMGTSLARSLARLPSFHAQNLGDLIAGRIGPEAIEANNGIFDRYLQSLSAERRAKAEPRRLAVAGRPVHHRPHHHGGTIAHDPVHSLFLVPGGGPHPGLPGNYLYGSLYETGKEAQPWALGIHDNDDGTAVFEGPSLPDTLAKLQETLDSAPFTMDELEALGYRMI